MFFYLSQFFSFLLMPLTLVLLLLLSGIIWYGKPVGKKLIFAGFILLLFFTNSFISNSMMNWWEQPFKDISSLPEYEVGIVLTGVTNLNKTVYDRTFFNKGADRITHALQLYNLGKVKKILISGGQGLNPANSNTEAELLGDFLLMAGVEQSDIILENMALNTRENATFSKKTMDQIGIAPEGRHLLITSAFHMYRAKACFDKTGLNTDTFPVDFYATDLRFSFRNLTQPDPYSLHIWHKLFKEWMGILVYKAVGYL